MNVWTIPISDQNFSEKFEKSSLSSKYHIYLLLIRVVEAITFGRRIEIGEIPFFKYISIPMKPKNRQLPRSLSLWLQKDPRNVFFFDGAGAAMSAILILGPLSLFSEAIGMSKDSLLLLGLVACLFCMYDLICVVSVKTEKPTLLKVIMLANLSYVFLTLVVLAIQGGAVTALGWIYFISEFLVVGLVVKTEIDLLKHWI
jgi:hypothetical protein